MGTVANFQFAIGNGVATDFTLLDPSGAAAVNPVVSSLYQTDWQGKQILYTTARTNLMTYSEAMASWATKTDLTIADDNIIAPDENQTADRITTGTAGTDNLVSAARPIVNGSTNTLSFHLKYSNIRWLRCIYIDNTGSDRVTQWVDLQNGVLGTLSAGGAGTAVGSTIKDLGGGWHRVTITGVLGTRTSATCSIVTASANGSTTRVNNSVYYMWGVQLEAGAAATAYIGPTAAASVPRTDYSVSGSVATLSPAPLDRALLEWSGTDDNAAFIPSHAAASMASGFASMGVR